MGTNNLKQYRVDSKKDVDNVFKLYIQKVSDILLLNPRCNVFIQPIIPTKFANVNRKVMHFNFLLETEMINRFPRVSLVPGCNGFADRGSGLLSEPLSRRKSDPLHLNGEGLSHLVRNIKLIIFQRKKGGSKIQSNRAWANVARPGPRGPG